MRAFPITFVCSKVIQSNSSRASKIQDFKCLKNKIFVYDSIDIHIAKLMSEYKTIVTPEKQVKHQICHGLVNEFEPTLAALAWKFFKEKGRGYIYFTIKADVEHEKGNTFKVSNSKLPDELFYFARGSELFNNARKSEQNAGQSEEWEPFYKLVDSYEVKYQYLVVVGCQSTEKMTEHWFIRTPEKPPYKTRV